MVTTEIPTPETPTTNEIAPNAIRPKEVKDVAKGLDILQQLQQKLNPFYAPSLNAEGNPALNSLLSQWNSFATNPLKSSEATEKTIPTEREQIIGEMIDNVSYLFEFEQDPEKQREINERVKNSLCALDLLDSTDKVDVLINTYKSAGERGLRAILRKTIKDNEGLRNFPTSRYLDISHTLINIGVDHLVKEHIQQKVSKRVPLEAKLDVLNNHDAEQDKIKSPNRKIREG